MGSSLPSPRKDLEFVPIKHQGRDYVLVRDRLGLVKQGTALPAALYHFLVLLDAAEDERQLQLSLTQQSGGRLVALEDIRKVLRDLDRSILLESDAYRQAKADLVAEFSAMSQRAPALSGSAYPSEAGALSDSLGRLLEGRCNESTASDQGGLLALIAPHIDLAVGGDAYARAYAPLAGSRPERVIVLGVGHSMGQELFSVTGKDFDTPLGTVPADREAVARLEATGSASLARNDFAHRFEHSIEFQSLFLKYVLPKDSFKMVPVLCGSAWSLPEYSRQAFLDRAGAFLDRLRSLVRDPSTSTMVVAGVDFSHIGPKFGHEQDVQRLKPKAEEHDRRLLQALCRLDAEAFWSESRQVKDGYNVCGFSALASLLEILPDCRGEVLAYSLWEEQATSSGVSFAAAAFFRPA